MPENPVSNRNKNCKDFNINDWENKDSEKFHGYFVDTNEIESRYMLEFLEILLSEQTKNKRAMENLIVFFWRNR